MFNAYTLLYELNKNIYGQIFFYVSAAVVKASAVARFMICP